ncbi:hypothetical protein PInf_023369 [Phytophthora infestans]|nr:hypothetical protein PInf_023369 [Phytophthora infestans]
MFSNNKIFALCIAVVALSSHVQAEKQVAETFGLLGVPGVGVGVPGVASVGVGVGVGVPGVASVGVGVGLNGVGVGVPGVGVGVNGVGVGVGVNGVGVGVNGVGVGVGVPGVASVGVGASPVVGVNGVHVGAPATVVHDGVDVGVGTGASKTVTVTSDDGASTAKTSTGTGGASATATASASANANANAGAKAETGKSSYRLDEFLGDLPSFFTSKTSASKGKKMFHCVLYLAPGDYHRIHAPTAARLIPSLFVENERVALLGEWEHGFFSLTAVGATNVGSIVITKEPEFRTNTALQDPLMATA